MTLTRPAALLFDLDGCLLDTEPLYTRATQEVLDEYGKKFEWSLKSQLMGRDLLEGARLLVRQLELPLGPEEYLARCEPRLLELFRSCEPRAGAEDFVRWVGGRFPLAIATSSERFLYELKVAHHPWVELFSAVVCGDHPDVRALKPSPDIFLTAAAALGVAPERCLVFEDAPSGVMAARAAGMQVVALPDPRIGHERVGQAQLIVESWAEARQQLSVLLG